MTKDQAKTIIAAIYADDKEAAVNAVLDAIGEPKEVITKEVVIKVEGQPVYRYPPYYPWADYPLVRWTTDVGTDVKPSTYLGRFSDFYTDGNSAGIGYSGPDYVMT